MLGTHHSWAITMRNLLLQFKSKGHKLYLKSINGKDFIPPDLLSRVDRDIAIPDIDICYTLPRNFYSRFKKKSKLKMAIYNYETEIMPKMWLDSIKHVDFVLPSSNFSKEVFVNSGWPESKCVVVPHGINLDDFSTEETFKLKTDRKFKFLNISIPHYRKNIDLLIDAYYTTFSDKDDVCLVLKTSLDMPKDRKPYNFEIDVRNAIKLLQAKHKDRPGGLPRIEIIQQNLPSMIPLYKACDALISTSSSEGFGLPLLEGLAAGNLVIAPRCSGQLDFLNNQNSLLMDVESIDAGSKYQYWIASPGAKTFIPKKELIIESMLMAYRNSLLLKQKFAEEAKNTCQKFTWESAATKITDLYK